MEVFAIITISEQQQNSLCFKDLFFLALHKKITASESVSWRKGAWVCGLEHSCIPVAARKVFSWRRAEEQRKIGSQQG